jgi:hypothetical protein
MAKSKISYQRQSCKANMAIENLGDIEQTYCFRGHANPRRQPSVPEETAADFPQ